MNIGIKLSIIESHFREQNGSEHTKDRITGVSHGRSAASRSQQVVTGVV
jgi:hypothetical protein